MSFHFATNFLGKYLKGIKDSSLDQNYGMKLYHSLELQDIPFYEFKVELKQICLHLHEKENISYMKSFLTFLSFQPKMFSGFRVILNRQREHFCHHLSFIFYAMVK